ncbi:MAG: hypothetical protein ACRDNF_15610 [Streptosporangiaceae bacterium]
MTHPADDPDPIKALRARNRLARTVRAALKGSGLDIRDNDNQLIITNPGHPGHGRIYITYARGDVSHGRTIWTYLGHLDRPGSNPTPDEPPIDTDTIIRKLTGQDGDPP